MIDVGVLFERDHQADWLWNQCDGPMGQHRGVRLINDATDAPNLVSFGSPIPGEYRMRLGGWRREWAVWRGRLEDERMAHAWERVRTPRQRTDVVFYEPPVYVKDQGYAWAKAHARAVFGPDPRATHRLRLPSTFSLPGTVHDWRSWQPGDKPVPLACVTSGKGFLPGHVERLRFIGMARAAGVEMELFGRGVPAELGTRGPVMDKGQALRPARLALAIENDGATDLYVSEKLWDALACWCVPVYFGSRAMDSMIPPEAVVRLPDLGQGGLEVLRQALADPGLWQRKLEAVAEARRLAMSSLRMVEWIADRFEAG
ncbi:MAG: hypothetical protein C0475_05445 [Planctomyces sp.]|nr:hypothetical protein [Planctomyces sp.]